MLQGAQIRCSVTTQSRELEWERGREVHEEGAYIQPLLIHVDVWQNPTQYSKAISLQLKINKFKF